MYEGHEAAHVSAPAVFKVFGLRTFLPALGWLLGTLNIKNGLCVKLIAATT